MAVRYAVQHAARRPLRRVLGALLLGIAGAWLALLAVPALGQSTAQTLISQVIGVGGGPALIPTGANYGVVGVGSWITGQNYRDPLGNFARPSDHDLRVVVPSTASREEALQIYNTVRSRIISRVNVQFGSRAPEVLRSINIYLPNQLMVGVTNESEAIQAMREAGVVTPNLGGEAVEGLWTSGRFEFTRAYETKGRLFYNSGGQMRAGYADILSDVIHGEPDVAINTLRGAAQNGEAFASKALKALKDDKPEDLVKNLTRAEGAMQRGRGLAGMQRETSALFEEIRAASKANPELFHLDPAMQRKIAQYTKQVALESRLIERLETSTVKDKELILKWLQEIRQGASTGEKLMELMSRVPFNEIGQCMRVLFLWFEGYVIAGKIGAGDIDGGLREALVYGTFEALGVGPGFVLTIANSMIEDAKTFGFDLMASTQDCEDLLAGVFTVKGREVNILDTNVRPLSIDQLLLKCQDEQCVRTEIGYRARLATDRGLGKATGESDLQIEDRLNTRCGNEILTKWARRRNDVERLVLHGIRSFKHAPVALSYSPDPATFKEAAKPYVIHLQLGAAGADHAAIEREIRANLALLSGKSFSTSIDYAIAIERQPLETLRGRASFVASREGGYVAVGVATLKVYAATLPVIEPVNVAAEAFIDVRIEREEKKPDPVQPPPPPLPEPPKPPAAGPETAKPTPGSASAPACSFEYSAWGECVRASKTQTRSVTSRKPAGCVESAKPALEQGCTPPPTEEDKRNAYLNCLCRCSSGWAGHIGVWYDPEQKTVPECKSSGPCIGGIGAWGCSSRHYFVGPNDCAKGCWDSAFGKDSYDAAKADKMRKDENKKFKQPLKVKIAASKNPADFGDIVDLTATATEGSGGYHDWNWGGCAQDAKETQAKVLNSRSCSACQATVSVTDNDGDTASDSLTIQCTALKVKLTKESPKENRIPVGGQAKFFAEVFSGDKPAGGSFSYIWERNPDAIFGDPKNPAYETQGGSQSRNSAVFRKLGTTPVWVSVLKDIGGKKTTVGESEQIPIEVVSPKLTLAAEPKDALVGQEVKITVTEDPKMSDDLLSFWWEIAGDANNPGPVSNVPNSRAYSFKSKNDRPVTVTVHAKAKDGGDELGVEKISLTAKKPAVTVSGPKIAGPAPMIWKEGVGLVTVGQQIAEAQRVEFAVAVAPDPKQDLRYQWTVAPEGCSITAPASKETGVTCSKVGGYTMTATVKNADGAELGSGSGSLSVTISLSDITKGKQKDEANKKLVRAKELWGEKKYDEAVTEALAASAIDAAIAAPVLGQFGTESKAMGAAAVAAGDYAAAQKHYERALRINPADQDAKTRTQAAQAKAARVAELKSKVAKVAQDPALPAKSVLDQARTDADELATLLPGNAEVQGYRQRIQEKLQALAARDDKAAQAKVLRDEGAALQQQGKLGEAIGKYRGSLALVPDRALEDHIRQIEGQLAAERQKQQQATALWNEGRALYDAGKPQDALAKFRDSVKLWPDAANQRYIAELEAKLTQNRSRAQQLRGEAEALQQQGRVAEAIGKFKESLTLVPDRALEDHIRQLEGRLAADRQKQSQAAALWNEGRAQFDAGKPQEALAKFRDSVKLWPDAGNQRYIADLEAQLAQQAQRKAEAQRLRDEAYGLQQQNRLPEAVRKYRESLALWPDPELERHVRQIEAVMNAPPVAPPVVATPSYPVSPPSSPSTPQPVIYENGNTGGVGNGPTRATTFTLNSAHAITLLQTYHWNNGRGATPGTIGLRDATGRMWGPWAVRTTPGQGGVPNAYWNTNPNVVLPSGVYTVVDSDPSSWAQNSGSQGAGFVRVEGRAAGGRAYTSTPRDLQPVSPGTTAGATRVLSAVASAASTQFKQRTVPAFHVDTNVHDKTPYLITDAYEGALRIGGNQSVLLAGNAAGTAGWRVDNYLVVEIEWAGGSKAFWIGNGDALSRRSERLPQVGITSFEQGAFDITAQIPRNVDLRVRISALDYGGVGFVSDVYLVVR